MQPAELLERFLGEQDRADNHRFWDFIASWLLGALVPADPLPDRPAILRQVLLRSNGEIGTVDWLGFLLERCEHRSVLPRHFYHLFQDARSFQETVAGSGEAVHDRKSRERLESLLGRVRELGVHSSDDGLFAIFKDGSQDPCRIHCEFRPCLACSRQTHHDLRENGKMRCRDCDVESDGSDPLLAGMARESADAAKQPDKAIAEAAIARLSPEAFFALPPFRNLSSEQAECLKVSGNRPHQVVIAPAGAGKTRTLIARIAWAILVEGIPPSQIAVITFTAKAAREIMERLHAALFHAGLPPLVARSVLANTVHGFCYHLLRREYLRYGFTDQPKVLDAREAAELLLGVIEEGLENGRLAAVSSRLYNGNSLTMNAAGLVDRFRKGSTEPLRGIERITDLYAKYKKKNNLVDFTDQLDLVRHRLEEEEDCAKEIATSYRLMLVDEFQDSDPLQYRIFTRLMEGGARFFFVGDDDQAIYGFNGADNELIRRIAARDDTTRMVFTTNFRNNPLIIEAGNAVLACLSNRFGEKRIVPAASAGPHRRIITTDCRSDDKLAMEILSLLARPGCRPGDIAVLCRRKAERAAIFELLTRYRIPCRTRSQETSQIERDLFRFIENTLSIAFLDGAGAYGRVRTIVSLFRQYRKEIASARDLEGVLVAFLEGRPVRTGFRLLTSYIELLSRLRLQEENAHQAARRVARFGLHLLGNNAQFDEFPLVDRMLNRIDRLPLSSCDTTWWRATLTDARAILAEEKQDEGKQDDAVFVSTMHTAKGLEFDIVFVYNVTLRKFPTYWMAERELEEAKAELVRFELSRSEVEQTNPERWQVLLDGLSGIDPGVLAWHEEATEILRSLQQGIREDSRLIQRKNADALQSLARKSAGVLNRIERAFADERQDLLNARDRLERDRNTMYARLAAEEPVHARLGDRQARLQALLKRIAALPTDPVLQTRGNRLAQELAETEVLAAAAADRINGIQSIVNQAAETLVVHDGTSKAAEARRAACAPALAALATAESEFRIFCALLHEAALVSRQELVIAELQERFEKTKQEEYRLYYVSITRARELLYLHYVEKPSEFVTILPNHLLESRQLGITPPIADELRAAVAALDKTARRAADALLAGRDPRDEWILDACLEAAETLRRTTGFLRPGDTVRDIFSIISMENWEDETRRLVGNAALAALVNHRDLGDTRLGTLVFLAAARPLLPDPANPDDLHHLDEVLAAALRSERGVRNNENRGLYRIALDTAGRWLREVG